MDKWHLVEILDTPLICLGLDSWVGTGQHLLVKRGLAAAVEQVRENFVEPLGVTHTVKALVAEIAVEANDHSLKLGSTSLLGETDDAVNLAKTVASENQLLGCGDVGLNLVGCVD